MSLYSKKLGPRGNGEIILAGKASNDLLSPFVSYVMKFGNVFLRHRRCVVGRSE